MFNYVLTCVYTVYSFLTAHTHIYIYTCTSTYIHIYIYTYIHIQRYWRRCHQRQCQVPYCPIASCLQFPLLARWMLRMAMLQLQDKLSHLVLVVPFCPREVLSAAGWWKMIGKWETYFITQLTIGHTGTWWSTICVFWLTLFSDKVKWEDLERCSNLFQSWLASTRILCFEGKAGSVTFSKNVPVQGPPWDFYMSKSHPRESLLEWFKHVKTHWLQSPICCIKKLRWAMSISSLFVSGLWPCPLFPAEEEKPHPRASSASRHPPLREWNRVKMSWAYASYAW